MNRGWTLFDTAIGTCGIAWQERELLGVQLPARSLTATAARVAMQRPHLPRIDPPWPDPVNQVIQGVRALLEGRHVDLSNVALDYAGVPAFDQRVYEIARTIPAGETLTYGEVAARLGDPGLARAVGQALGRNPFPLVVPCHRVVAAEGALGGFSAPGGTATKRQLLVIEAAQGRLPF